jgi:hypothetical protein
MDRDKVDLKVVQTQRESNFRGSQEAHRVFDFIGRKEA